MLVDYHVHLMGHGEREYTYENLSAFVRRAAKNKIMELGLADHEWYLEKIKFDVVEEVAHRIPGIKLRTGLEVDYSPVRETIIGKYLEKLPFDFVIGSVHDIDGIPIDHPDRMEAFLQWEPEELYRRYFKLVSSAVRSGLFDIIGHLDLIKVFKVRPQKSVLEHVNPLLEEIREAGLVVELNMNGLNKPVREPYPERKILERCFQLGIPLTLSSDAHRHEDAGKAIAFGATILREIGYTKIAGFCRRDMYLTDL